MEKTSGSSKATRNQNKLPYVKILEQPTSKGVRFRYECEGRFAENIVGEKTSASEKSFPTIQIVNYNGPAFVVVSCVSKSPPYYPHPHNLVGKTKEVSNGICYFKTMSEDMTVSFANLGIQCVKRKDIEKSLLLRKKLQVDPFNTGFKHIQDPDSIDLYCVRLCFQIFLEGKQKGNFNVPLLPVVSDQIHDRRVRIEPTINYISHDSASVTGGTEICILCERATKDDIQVRFYHEDKDWEAIAEFTPPSVYKKVSIVFKSPRYFEQDITEPVNVKIQLRRMSDGETSEPIPFQYTPLESCNVPVAVKRKRTCDTLISTQIQAEAAKNAALIRLAQSNDPNVHQAEPWELPHYLMTACNPDQSAINEQTDNEVLQSISTTNELQPYDTQITYNIPNEPSAQNSQIYQIPDVMRAIQQSQKQQHSSETLNSDSWIKDLLDTINCEALLTSSTKNSHKIAQEPETQYIGPDSNSCSNLNESNDLIDLDITPINDVIPSNIAVDSGLNISDLLKELKENINNELTNYDENVAMSGAINNNNNNDVLDMESMLHQSKGSSANETYNHIFSQSLPFNFDNQLLNQSAQIYCQNEEPSSLHYINLDSQNIPNCHPQNTGKSQNFNTMDVDSNLIPQNTNLIPSELLFSHLNNNNYISNCLNK